MQVSHKEINWYDLGEKGYCGCNIVGRLELEKQMEGRFQDLEGQGKFFFYPKSDRKSTANI